MNPPAPIPRLHLDTRRALDALDRSLDLLGHPLSLKQYVRRLGCFQGFHPAIEPVLATTLEPSLLPGHSELAILAQSAGPCHQACDRSLARGDPKHSPTG